MESNGKCVTVKYRNTAKIRNVLLTLLTKLAAPRRTVDYVEASYHLYDLQ